MGLTRQLQTMHLVEALAVALYQFPRGRLAGLPWLQREFAHFEAGELRHRSLFSALLVERGASPFRFARYLAALVGGFAWLVAWVCGPWWLLRLEILIEKVAIAHYGQLLAAGTLGSLTPLVEEVRTDERAHLAQMQALLERRGTTDQTHRDVSGQSR